MFVDFKNFAQAKKLKHNGPPKRAIERVEQQKNDKNFVLAKFLASGDQLPIEDAPSNTSTDTINDARRVAETMQSASDAMRKFSQKIDPNEPHYQMWADVATEISGKKYTSEWFRKIIRQTDSFIDYAKLKYNRPRPFQLGPLIGVDVKRIVTDPITAAYPSAHAFEGWLFAYILEKMYPEHRQHLHDVAEQVALSRVVVGVHFFSDIEAGQKLAKYVVQKGFIDVPE